MFILVCNALPKGNLKKLVSSALYLVKPTLSTAQFSPYPSAHEPFINMCCKLFRTNPL